MPRIPRMPIVPRRMPIVRQPFLVQNKRAYYDDGRFISEEPQLVIAHDAEALRNYMANCGFARPVEPSDIDVAPYYGPYLPDTEDLMRKPRMNLYEWIDKYEPRDYLDPENSNAFSMEDYWILQALRQEAARKRMEAEAKRRAREEYLDNIEWYQD